MKLSELNEMAEMFEIEDCGLQFGSRARVHNIGSLMLVNGNLILIEEPEPELMTHAEWMDKEDK